MKKYALIMLVAGFSVVFTAGAQNQMRQGGQRGMRPEMREKIAEQLTPQARAERLTKELQLTDAEKAKVQALFEKQDAEREKRKAEMKKEKEKADKKREEMKAAMQAEMKAQDAELEKIIGTEKFEKFKTSREERMKRMEQRRQGGQRPANQNTPE